MKFCHQGFHGTTEGVQRMLDAVLSKHPQQAISIGCPSHIHGIFGQFIHCGEIACQPVSVGEIEPLALGLEKSLTRFSTKTEDHIVPLRITRSAIYGYREQEEHEPP